MICPNPNCGYSGPVRKKARGNLVVGAILCLGSLALALLAWASGVGKASLLFLLPGALYALFARGYRFYCPKCGLQVAADA